jgi:methyl-accepting chemotaxis protein
MLSELLQDRAALYVSGTMTAAERENFELVLSFHDELGAHVADLQGVVTQVVSSYGSMTVSPPASLKQRLLASIATHPQPSEAEAIVVTDPTGAIEWVSASFSKMCGYRLSELKGRKPGHLLQGPATDPTAVGRIRSAVQGRRPCREALVNYHKDGSAYGTEVAITPILDDTGEALWFVAKERKLDLGAVGVPVA